MIAVRHDRPFHGLTGRGGPKEDTNARPHRALHCHRSWLERCSALSTLLDANEVPPPNPQNLKEFKAPKNGCNGPAAISGDGLTGCRQASRLRAQGPARQRRSLRPPKPRGERASGRRRGRSGRLAKADGRPGQNRIGAVNRTHTCGPPSACAVPARGADTLLGTQGRCHCPLPRIPRNYAWTWPPPPGAAPPAGEFSPVAPDSRRPRGLIRRANTGAASRRAALRYPSNT